MKLVLEPRERAALVSLYDDQGAVMREQLFQPSPGEGVDILGSVVALCREENFSLEDIETIGVVSSVGTFSTTRLIASLANTLHWLIGVPLTMKNPTQKNWTKARPDTYLKPQYSGEPNIT